MSKFRVVCHQKFYSDEGKYEKLASSKKEAKELGNQAIAEGSLFIEIINERGTSEGSLFRKDYYEYVATHEQWVEEDATYRCEL